MADSITVFSDNTEEEILLSTPKFSALTFSTQLPGGFAEGSFTLPKEFFAISTWKDKLLGKHVVAADSYGSRMYEGGIEGINDTAEGISVQVVGQYAKSGLKTAYLAYPTPPTNLRSVLREAVNLVSQWGTLIDVTDTTYAWTSEVELEFLFATKVQEMIESILKEHLDEAGNVMNFGVYDRSTPFLFNVLHPWFSVSKYDLSLTYGSTLSLSGTYNKIQVLYDVDGNTNFTDWYEDDYSQIKYGVREGSLNAGQAPAGVAQVAGELAIPRYSKPEEQHNIRVSGQLKNYYNGAPEDVWRLRAGHLLFVTDMEANPNSRFAFAYDKDQAGFLVTRTNYNHEDNSLTVETGDNVKSLENYLADMGISGGDVR